MKKQLKAHIELLKEPSNTEAIDFNHFIKRTNQILKDYDCTFRYLRSDSKRNGHIKATINKRTQEYKLELAINRKDNIGGQVYTIIHELTHLINNHMFSRDLTKKQAEVVADTTALYFINKYNLLTDYQTSDVGNKWDVNNYSNIYIDNMGLSKARYQVIIKQINDSKIIIERFYLG